jgi:hypothetical protein
MENVRLSDPAQMLMFEALPVQLEVLPAEALLQIVNVHLQTADPINQEGRLPAAAEVVIPLRSGEEAAATEAAVPTNPEAAPADQDHLPEAVDPPVPVPVQDPAVREAAPDQEADGNH